MPVQSQRIDYQVVHAIAGRIRIKIPRLQRDPKYADKLQQLVKSLSGVTDVRVNFANASIVVQYNPRSVENKVIQKELANCIQQASNIEAAVSATSEPSEKHEAETTEKDDAVTEVVSPTAEQTEGEHVAETTEKHDAVTEVVSPTAEQTEGEHVAETTEKHDAVTEVVSPTAEQTEGEHVAETTEKHDAVTEAVSPTAEQTEGEHVAETTEKHDAVTEAVSPTAEQRENKVIKVIQKSIGIQISEEHLSSEQFPINVDQERKVFEVGIPAPYILEPLNAELDKFEAENEKNTELQRIRVKLEAFLKEGGFLINGRARGQFRESFIVNPFTRKKHYTPWVSITAVGTAELDAHVVDETISVKLTKVNVSGDSGKWYRKLVKYAFEYLFKNKLVAKINDALSKINGAKIQQLFFKLKGDEKLREHGQELGLTPEKLDELLELVEVNARVSPDHLWLSVQL